MKHFIVLLIASGLLFSCSKQDEPYDNKTAAYDCNPVKGIDEILSISNNKVILIGESHGTVETPLLVESLLCHSLKSGYKTALALEIYDEDNRYIDFIHSDGGQVSLNALFTGDWMWEGQFTDGRSSLAMLKLLNVARIYKVSNAKIDLITFQAGDIYDQKFSDANSRSQAYENKMAENVLSKVDNYDKIIGLVGSVHARRAHYKRGQLSYDLMAFHMPLPESLTFKVVSNGGTAWNCRGPEPEDCGAYPSEASVDPKSALASTTGFSILLNNNSYIRDVKDRYFKPDWYDGVVYVGDVTASPPANVLGRKPYEEVDK